MGQLGHGGSLVAIDQRDGWSCNHTPEGAKKLARFHGILHNWG
ncbi:hypothetical protein EPIB2_1052 [Tritonibacter mobilis]|nr:hypothetical protein EPIB2_1052 [Tritonibacter mobilis]